MLGISAYYRGRISWSKNCVMIEKCKDPLERGFYIRITKKFGWTKDVLINNIENQAYALRLSKAQIGVATYKKPSK